MSVYHRRFHVSENMVSHYTDDPAAALGFYADGLAAYYSGECEHPPYITEGYGYESDGPNDTLCVTRRTIGKVLPSTLEFLVIRGAVQKMLEEIR